MSGAERAVFRRRRPAAPTSAVDLAAVPPAWRPAVERIVDSGRRFRDLIDQIEPGPLRDRLGQLGGQVEAGVQGALDVVARARRADQALAGFDLERVTAEHKEAKRALTAAEAAGQDTAALQARADAMGARHAAAHQLRNTVDDTAARLDLIEVRLEASVARAATLLVRPADDHGFDELAGELDAVVGELGQLSAALGELD